MTDTRERLLDGFAEQLLEWGYRGTSLDALAKAVGIRRPSLYHHFPGGKEQLYSEVALRIIDEDAERLGVALTAGDELRPRLLALAQLHADDPRKQALDQRIYDATRYVSDETRTLVSTRYVEDLLDPVNEMMASAVEAGELRNLEPSLLTMIFFGMAGAVQEMPDDVAMPPDRRAPRRRTTEQTAEAVVEVFLEGAGAEA